LKLKLINKKKEIKIKIHKKQTKLNLFPQKMIKYKVYKNNKLYKFY